MKNFDMTLDTNDIPAALQESMSEMDSLRVSRREWAEVLGMYDHYSIPKDAPRLTAAQAAERLVCEAVPEVGFPHPQRAIATVEDGVVEFFTPGGVSVQLSVQEDGSVVLNVDFGRDSRWLCTAILFGLSRRVRSARCALAAAAEDLYQNEVEFA